MTSRPRPTTTALGPKYANLITRRLSEWTSDVLDKAAPKQLTQDPELSRLVYEHILPIPELQEAMRSLHHHVIPYTARYPVSLYVAVDFHRLRFEVGNAFPMLADGVGNIIIKYEDLPQDSPLAQYLTPLVKRYRMCYDRGEMVKSAVKELLQQAKTLEQVVKSAPALASFLPKPVTPGPRVRAIPVPDDLNAAILYLRMLEAST